VRWLSALRTEYRLGYVMGVGIYFACALRTDPLRAAVSAGLRDFLFYFALIRANVEMQVGRANEVVHLIKGTNSCCTSKLSCDVEF
jgi:hypothetical protein